MAIYWKYLKIQLNSWSADSVVCKINILSNARIANITFLKPLMYTYSLV